MMGKAATRTATSRDAEIMAAVQTAKAKRDTARLRKAALELLAAIHERMAGVTEEEVLAAVDADGRRTVRRQSTRKQRAGERTRRRRASA
ncbi:MAG: hypothetical protein EPO22_13880 [Dehalococcoidia bacterium]|nr:MAG: hypothetical protein EPO22_13880 [Dehalococcoidia bacterium]